MALHLIMTLHDGAPADCAYIEASTMLSVAMLQCSESLL